MNTECVSFWDMLQAVVSIRNTEPERSEACTMRFRYRAPVQIGRNLPEIAKERASVHMEDS
jgi:hypothetical protein